MTSPNRVGPGPSSADTLVLILILASAAAACVTWLPVHLAEPPGYTGGGPIDVAFGVLGGRITWTSECTLWLIAVLAGFAVVGAGVLVVWRRVRGRRTRVDRVARSMATRRDVAHLTGKAALEKARRLQPSREDAPASQVPLGPILLRRMGLVGPGEVLRASAEDIVIVFAGMRSGKTTSQAIPNIVEYPGPLIATSAKRDVVDATRGVRERLSPQGVWIFDPQDMVGLDAQDTWWYDPLAGCERFDIAMRRAAILAAAEREPGARIDAHFDNAAKQLIASMLQAAALGGKTIVDVYSWLMDPDAPEPEPVRLLSQAGQHDTGRALFNKYNEPDKMKGSTFGTAQTMMTFLANERIQQWVTPQARRKFSPDQFVASQADTLYLLSEGGVGSPAPLLAILNDALSEAAKARANAMGGRLDPYILTIMDEAANLIRDPDLPRKVTHYGSRGMPMVIILQTYAQGEETWGRGGMRALWSAANHVLYMGGVKDPQFLEWLSQLIGEHDVPIRTVSTSGSGLSRQSVSYATRRQRILSVSDLMAMPTGRAVLLSSGTPPVLGETVPWMDGPYAAAVRESLAKYQPSPQSPAPAGGNHVWRQ